MKSRTSQIPAKDWLSIAIILTGAAVIRGINYGDFSYSNDELSAIYRLSASGIADLWNNGVKFDGHPALVQTFLWIWVKIFPDAAWSVRLPFVLSGLGSIYYIWRLGRLWFGPTSALMAAAGLAFLQYPVIMTMVARPYAFGLFFTLMAAFYWTLYFRGANKGLLKYAIGFGIAALLAMYTHYFSFLSVGIMGITGLFFLSGKNLKGVGIALLIMIIGFIPHLKITLYQLGVGGIGNWLGKPGKWWYKAYLERMFQWEGPMKYGLILLTLVALISLSLQYFRENKTAFPVKSWLIAATWAIIPFLTGFFYSREVNPVLQDSVLLFSFPFLLLCWTSLFDFVPGKMKIYIVFLFTALVLYTTLFTRQHFKRDYFGVFKEVAAFMVTENQQPHTLTIGNFNHRNYIGYYFHAWKTGDPVDLYLNEHPENMLQVLHEVLDTTTAERVVFGWSNQSTPLEITRAIRETFPYLEKHAFRLNAEMYVFTREAANDHPLKSIRYAWYPGMEPGIWKDTIIANAPVDSLYFSATQEYGPTFEIPLQNLVTDPSQILHLEVYIEPDSLPVNPLAVIQVDRNGQAVYWYGMETMKYHAIDQKGKYCIAASIRLNDPVLQKDTDILKVFAWNREKQTFSLLKMQLILEEGNPIIYGYDRQ